jgi:hypothetical protein
MEGEEREKENLYKFKGFVKNGGGELINKVCGIIGKVFFVEHFVKVV